MARRPASGALSGRQGGDITHPSRSDEDALPRYTRTMHDKLKPGDHAPDFQLPATDGSTIHLADQLTRFGAIVVMFLCNHCPYVKAYLPRLVQLQGRFRRPGSDGACFTAICSNDAQAYPEDNFEQMRQVAAQYKFNFPYLRDEDQSVARAYGAERTPEIFVLDREGICRYEGGVDDYYQDPDKVTQQYLGDALESILQGRPVDRPQTYAIGCTIKWTAR